MLARFSSSWKFWLAAAVVVALAVVDLYLAQLMASTMKETQPDGQYQPPMPAEMLHLAKQMIGDLRWAAVFLILASIAFIASRGKMTFAFILTYFGIALFFQARAHHVSDLYFGDPGGGNSMPIADWTSLIFWLIICTALGWPMMNRTAAGIQNVKLAYMIGAAPAIVAVVAVIVSAATSQTRAAESSAQATDTFAYRRIAVVARPTKETIAARGTEPDDPQMTIAARDFEESEQLHFAECDTNFAEVRERIDAWKNGGTPVTRSVTLESMALWYMMNGCSMGATDQKNFKEITLQTLAVPDLAVLPAMASEDKGLAETACSDSVEMFAQVTSLSKEVAGSFQGVGNIDYANQVMAAGQQERDELIASYDAHCTSAPMPAGT